MMTGAYTRWASGYTRLRRCRARPCAAAPSVSSGLSVTLGAATAPPLDASSALSLDATSAAPSPLESNEILSSLLPRFGAQLPVSIHLPAT